MKYSAVEVLSQTLILLTALEKPHLIPESGPPCDCVTIASSGYLGHYSPLPTQKYVLQLHWYEEGHDPGWIHLNSSHYIFF